MRVFLAGGTGAIGRRLLPRLIEAGHEVTALARSTDKARALEAAGARAAIADALDGAALRGAVVGADPDIVIHQLTALSGPIDFRTFDRDFARTNRLRTEALDTMLDAAREVGARRFIAQSFCGWPYARVGGPVKTEDDPLDPDPPRSFRQTLDAIRHLESAVGTGEDRMEGVVLRYGFLYGPGTAIARDGPIAGLVGKRRLPLVGKGAGVWSFVHVEDAATATLAAVTQGAPGIYNVVDDEPAPVARWLPWLADVLDARRPMRLPAWLARLVIGEGGVSMMTKIRGGSNAKAKSAFGWTLRYPSWKAGFREELG